MLRDLLQLDILFAHADRALLILMHYLRDYHRLGHRYRILAHTFFQFFFLPLDYDVLSMAENRINSTCYNSSFLLYKL